VASRRLLSFFFAFLFLVAVHGPWRVSAGDEWQPISPEELKMTSEPKAPGAPAVILYRQVDRDDTAYKEFEYVRIKILTEEGRKYGDVEIPMYKKDEQINSIKARTIGPDGSIVPFNGKVYTRPIKKAKGIKYMAKTFTLPEVQVGSIIEYKYISSWEQYLVYDSRWILSEELFTKHAKFTLKQNTHFALKWSWPVGLPQGTNPPKEDAGLIRLDAQNIPAFQTEDYMPPENELKFRVVFVYSEDGLEQDADKYWKHYGKKQYEKVESFIGKKRAMEEAVAQVVAPNDSPEVKLQKIYARVQQIRNTSYEVQKTTEQAKREKEKEINNVEELWKRQYGNGYQLTWLYLALARAAGLEAYPVLVSARSEYFFNPNLMDSSQLDANVVLVKLNGKEIYGDPGAKFNPFGLLPWVETGVKGRLFDKDGGTWVTTTLPDSAESQIERKAKLKVTEDGSLEGQLAVTYTGLEALSKRVEQRNQDEASRKTFLEDDVKEWVPAGIEVELTNKPVWDNSAASLTAEFNLKIPGWVSGAGHRAMLQVGLFGNSEKHVFEHANRVHPIYYAFPSEKSDDVTIDLPAGWQVSSVPAPQKDDGHVIVYTLKVDNNKNTLHLVRELSVNILLLDSKYYAALRNFYQVVRTGDEQQIVLQPGAAAATN
jgi:hypothetical protein